jgi:hypothetical protein
MLNNLLKGTDCQAAKNIYIYIFKTFVYNISGGTGYVGKITTANTFGWFPGQKIHYQCVCLSVEQLNC